MIYLAKTGMPISASKSSIFLKRVIVKIKFLSVVFVNRFGIKRDYKKSTPTTQIGLGMNQLRN